MGVWKIAEREMQDSWMYLGDEVCLPGYLRHTFVLVSGLTNACNRNRPKMFVIVFIFVPIG